MADLDKSKKTGFTIVELLIVVVVVAILATISVGVYNGVVAKATATKTLSLATQWRDSIQVYQAKKGKLPNDWTCLGNNVNDFPAKPSSSIGLGQCERNFIVSGQPSDWTSEYKTVPTPGQTLSTPELLRTNAAVAPGDLDMQTYGTNSYMRGIVYASIFDPALAPQNTPGAYIFYTLKGIDCSVGIQHRLLGDYRVCAIKLTTSNYANEIHVP